MASPSDEVSTLLTGTGYASASASQHQEEIVDETSDGEREVEAAGPSDSNVTELPRDSDLSSADNLLGPAEAPDPFSRRWIAEGIYPGCPPHPLFSVEQLGVDRRLIVNRKRQLKMYRVWIQGKFRKSLT